MARINEPSGDIILNGESVNPDNQCHVNINGKPVNDVHRHTITIQKIKNREVFKPAKQEDEKPLLNVLLAPKGLFLLWLVFAAIGFLITVFSMIH